MTAYVWRDGHWRDKRTGEPMEVPAGNVIVRPSVVSDLPAYKSPLGTGWIEGRAARREDLKRGNCREVDPGEWSPHREIKRREIDIRPVVRD